MKKAYVTVSVFALCLYAISAMALPDGAVRRLGKGKVEQVVFSPNGKYLAVGSSIGIWLYDAVTFEEVRLIETDNWVSSVTFCPDGKLLASSVYDNTVKLWEVPSGEEIKTLTGLTNAVMSVAFSLDGKLLASGSDDGTVLLWDMSPYIQEMPSKVTPKGKYPTTWGELRQTKLFQNYPNPFNPETWIPYQLRDGSEVEISIYSAKGQLVRKLSLGYKSTGLYISRDRAVYWDGKGETGEPVASGIYYYTIKASDFTAIRKMVVLR